MRFWITKNSELPIHEQIVRQVVLAIVSEDLPAGHKLPSIRAVARRHQIHSNTVSAAYHDLLDRGWLELRRGSGLYVRSPRPAATDASELDTLLVELLRVALSRGHEPKYVLQRLEQLIHPRRYERIAIIERDPGMREILTTELEERLGIPVEGVDPCDIARVTSFGACLATALPTRAEALREQLPHGVVLLTLRVRSVRESLEGETRPTANTLVSIVSKSPDFRRAAYAMLIAVGLDRECLCEIDATIDDWQERASATALVISDVVAARALPAGRQAKVFRVLADSCLAEIKQLCGV